MDAGVKDKILSRSRAKEYQGWAPPDLSLEDVRRRFGGPSVSDEELILRVYAGPEPVEAMHAAGQPRPYLNANQPLINLITELSKKKHFDRIAITKGNLSLALAKRSFSNRAV
jgi:oxaloacetate decarboxylase alpha subunit